MLPGATLHTYTVKPGDVGARIGCSAHPATAHVFVNAAGAAPVAAVEPTALAARVSLRPHIHHKFCDRRVRVCTAEGRYREGEVLRVLSRGAGLDGHHVVWTRSERVVGPDGHVLLAGAHEDAEGAVVAAAPASPSSASADAADAAAKALQQALRQRIVRLSAAELASLRFAVVPDRCLEHTPSTPAAHEAAQQPVEALAPPPAAPSARRAGPPAGAPFLPLELADVGCMVRAELRPLSGDGPVIVSNAVGPVEPAPPRARLIWIEGAAAVGCRLLGRWLYFGGSQGASEVSWVRVTPDGSSEVVKGPAKVRHGAMPPALAAPANAAADAHPCCYRLSGDDEGCVIKCRVLPVRADGDEGHAEAARLRSKIGPAPGDVAAAEAEAREAAATVLAAAAWRRHDSSPPEGEAGPHPWPGGVHLGNLRWAEE